MELLKDFDWTCPECGEPVNCSAYNMGVGCKWEDEKRAEYEQRKNKSVMKPIDRLKELYKLQINSEFTPSYKKNKARYLTSREFALCCDLVTFNEVELMEYKIENHE